MMPGRSLLALGLIGMLSTCADPTGSGNPRGFGSLAVRVAAPPSLVRFSPSLVLQQVKVVVGRSDPQQELFVPIDSATVSLTDAQNSISTRFRLLVAEAETLSVEVFYSAGDGTLLFEAFDQVVVKPGVTTPSPALQPFYVGPGSNIARISILPVDTVLASGEELTFDPQPFDVQGAPVPQFYISWATDDPRVPIDARGHIVAPPNLTKLINVTATAPNAVVGTQRVTIAGPAALGISPDSIEKLPNSTQLFQVTVGALRTSQFVWSVNGVDGGDATVGTINVDGTYAAPAVVPTPAKVAVCARDAASQVPRDGCAVVVIRAVPSVGAEVIVVNDLDVFDSIALHNPGNVRFIKNLVGFSGTGPRSAEKGVLYDRSRGDCLSDGACSDEMLAKMNAVLLGQGYSLLTVDSPSRLLSVPSTVKLLVLWLPKTTFDVEEINTLKRFAAEGGRILFVGEHSGYYTQIGLAVENQLLGDLGSGMVNLGSFYDCFVDSTPNDTTDNFPTIEDFAFTTSQTVRPHPLLNGVSKLAYLCASELQIGPNDYALFYDTANVHLLAGVAKIDLTPLIPPSTFLQAQPPTDPGPDARRPSPFGVRRQ